MKFVSKSVLHMENGYMLDAENNVVIPANNVIGLYNDLETKIQQIEYMKAQPEAYSGPSMDGFKRKSQLSKVALIADTPTLDEKVANSLKMMEEIEMSANVKAANKVLDRYRKVVEFVSSDSVLCADECDGDIRFDAPTLGNPLTLTQDKFVKLIASVCKLDEDIEDVESE